MKIRMYLSIGYPGAVQEDELDIEDGLPEWEIGVMVKDWAFDHIDWWYELAEEEK